MSVPEAKQDVRLCRYHLRRHRLSVAGGTLSVVCPVSGHDLLRGERGQRYIRDGQQPYWADIWPASVGLARLLMRGPRLEAVRVMDLGCGIGLAGLAAAVQGADVVFVDREPDALRFATFNARHNGARRTRCEQLDWFAQTSAARCDLILLADVAYEKKNYEPLARHLDACLRPGGEALLTDPFREATSGFLEYLRDRFDLRTEEFSAAFAGERTPLRLVRMRQVTG